MLKNEFVQIIERRKNEILKELNYSEEVIRDDIFKLLRQKSKIIFYPLEEELDLDGFHIEKSGQHLPDAPYVPRPTFPGFPSARSAHLIPAYSRRSINTDEACLNPTPLWRLFPCLFPSGSEFQAAVLSLHQGTPAPSRPGLHPANAGWEEPCVARVSPNPKSPSVPSSTHGCLTHSLARGLVLGVRRRQQMR